ncbi:MAG: magnesium/cobalt transporter CorA, partial [Planctomycetota bacterium]
RPKFEDYQHYAYVVLKMLYEGDDGRTVAEQVSIVIGKGYVISFQEKPGDVFAMLRRRIRDDKGRIRRMKADYLGYCLIDAIVDNYFVVLETFGDLVEQLEDSIIEDAREELLSDLFALKREGVSLRRTAWPLRELVSMMERGEPKVIGKEVRPYLRDLYDHVVQVVDTVETMRESASGMLDIYLSSVSNRMNEVMKVLTIIGSIFIPITFIAGIYGMNFDPGASPWNMPELAWRWGYPMALATMALVAGGMLLFFKRKRWI